MLIRGYKDLTLTNTGGSMRIKSKYLILILITFLVVGCAINPKPLKFSPPSLKETSISKLPYIRIVYPNHIYNKTISSRNFLTGIANTLNVKLGKNIKDVLYRQAKQYYDVVEVVNSNNNISNPKRLQIEVAALEGKIAKDLSVSGSLELIINSNSNYIQQERQTLFFEGKGSLGLTFWGGVFAASSILTQSEHEAMQNLIDQLSVVIKKSYKKSYEFAQSKRKAVDTTFDNQFNDQNNYFLSKSDLKQIETGKFYALLIGNNQYRVLPNLQSAVNDVQQIAKILENNYNFKIKTIVNADRSSIIHSISQYRYHLNYNDNLLIYYAGHGWLDQEADEGYWLPVDSDQKSSVNWISNASISTAIRAIPAKHIMVIADSCYSGKLTRGISIRNYPESYLSKILTKKARVVISSGGLEPVLDGGTNENNSIFASALIEELVENSSYLDGASLFSKIRERVGWNADQIPEYGVIQKAGHDGGDFVFIRRK